MLLLPGCSGSVWAHPALTLLLHSMHRTVAPRNHLLALPSSLNPSLLQPSAEALTAQEQGRAMDLCASQLSSRFDAKLGEQQL